MSLRKSGLLALGGLLLMTASAMAEDLAMGVSVMRELTDAHGHRFAVTFTPPADRALDKRTVDAFEISVSAEMPAAERAGEPSTASAQAGAQKLVSAMAARKAPVDSETDDPIDVSGLGITVRALAMPSCSAKITIAKSKPANLGSGKFVFVRATDGPASMTAVAYPTSGDVDAGIVINDDIECKVSEKPKGNLDVAGCTNSGCNSARDVVTGIIANPTGSTAKFVGAFSIVYSN